MTDSEQNESQEKREETAKRDKAALELIILQQKHEALLETLEQEKAFNADLKIRADAMNTAAFVFQHAIPLNENGSDVGKNLVACATVIERYLSGNSD